MALPAGFKLDQPTSAPAAETPRLPAGFVLDPPEIKQDYPVRRAVSKYLIRPVIESGAMTLGGVAGAIAGAPAGPIGSGLAGFAGGAAMYPPAHEAANRVDEMIGIGGRRKPVSDLERTLGELKTGAEIEAGGKAIGAAVKGGADFAVGKGVPTLFGPSREAVAARIENQEAIKNAPTYLEQAERLPKVLKNIGTAIDKTSAHADSFLSNSPDPTQGAVPVTQLTGILNGLQQNLKVGDATVGASDKAATAKLTSLITDLNEIIKRPTPAPILGPSGQPIQIPQAEAFISQAALKKAIQRIRKDINFADKGANVTNSVLTDVSGKLDAVLKTGNPDYAAAMRPVAKLMKIYNDAQDKFALTKNTGEGLQHSDATISSMKTLPAERRGVSQKVMGRIKAVTGDDFVQKSKDRALADQFVGGNAQGTRRAFGGATIGGGIGAGIGSLVGHPTAGATIGSQIGTLAGMATDVSGREMGAKVIDSYVRAKPWLAKLPYEVIVRLISSGVLGGDTAGDKNNGQ